MSPWRGPRSASRPPRPAREAARSASSPSPSDIHISVRQAAILPSAGRAASCVRPAAAPWDRSHARPRASIARAPGCHGARHEGRVRRRILMAVHAVAAGAIEIMRRSCSAGSPRKSAKASGSDACPAKRSRSSPCRPHIGDGAGRPDRAMRLHRPIEFALQAIARRGERGGRVAFVRQDFVALERLRRASIRAAPLSPTGGRAPPISPSARARRSRVPFVVGDDAEEILDAHDLRAGNMRDRALVDRDELALDRGRPHRAPMQHAGRLRNCGCRGVCRSPWRECRAAAKPCRRARNRQDPAAAPSGRASARMAVADQLAEADAGAPALRADLARDGLDIGGREAETLGAQAQQRLASRRRGLTELHAATRDPRASRPSGLDPASRRYRLRRARSCRGRCRAPRPPFAEGGAKPGAEIDLAAINRRASVSMKRKEGIDERGIEDAARPPTSLAPRRPRRGEADKRAPVPFRKVAARKRSSSSFPPGRAHHRAQHAIMRAAAAEIPRERLASFPRGWLVDFASRDAALVITMPLVQ